MQLRAVMEPGVLLQAKPATNMDSHEQSEQRRCVMPEETIGQQQITHTHQKPPVRARGPC